MNQELVEFPFYKVVCIRVYNGKVAIQEGGKGSKRDKIIVDKRWQPELKDGVLTVTYPTPKDGDPAPPPIITPKNTWVKIRDELRRDSPPT